MSEAPVCVVVQPIAAPGINLLREAGVNVREAPATDLATLAPLLADAVAVVTRNAGLSAAAIAAAPRLVVIASHGTGVDRIDLSAAAARGIHVVNTPGTNAHSVAEHALALMFAAARHVTAADSAVRSGDFAIRDRLAGIELRGRCVGLWGYGRVARSLATLAAALGMRVLVHSAHATAAEIAADGHMAADRDTLLAEADVLSLHAVPRGRPILDAEVLARMKPGAILVNTARGALVDEVALVAALEEGRLRAAALDVFTEEPLPAGSPLCRCPNLILTPHIGGSTAEALARTSTAVAEAILKALGLLRS